MPAATAARLAAAPLSYDDVGATAGELPPGYAHLRTRGVVPRSTSFAEAVDVLMTWGVHERAGLDIESSKPRVAPDAVVLLRRRWGPFSVTAPCRVVRVIAEPTRAGFAYGTLPGHPEAGEESFIVEVQANGMVVFTITAYSRPASALARAGGPLTRRAQAAITRRYLAAFDT